MKKFRIITLVLVALVAILSLSSCASDVVAYSTDSRISIVYSETASTPTDRVSYNKIVSAITEHIGDNCRRITDVNKQSNFEIVVGESNRDVTALAKEFLAANTPADGDTESYVFYYKDNSIAIVASSEFSMEIAVDVFVERYLSENTLIVRSDMLDFKTFSKTAYLAELDEKITAAEGEDWEERRWDAVRAIVGNTGVDAIKRLYDFWRPEDAHESGNDWLDWTIGLYDPETGGFYYAASARDYYGFGPDIESTAQIFNLYDEFGLFNWRGDKWIDNVPAEMREKLGTWVQNLQSQADGYFYHPQWGEGIGTSAKGRHLSQAVYLLWVAGVDPLRKTPLDTDSTAMGGTSDVISAFMETEEHKSSVIYTSSTLPDYMKSVEAVNRYLDEQWAAHYGEASGQNSYGFGHLLSSQSNQFAAAGEDIVNAVCDWLDEHQREDNGFWEEITEENPDSAYRAISGLIKISGVYGAANRAFGHTDKMIDTAIDIMLSDVPPAHVCYIYNPIGAYKSILSAMKKVNIDTTAAKQKFIYKLPEILDTVIEKQTVFRKESGSFSYVPTRSDPNSQGLRISLGLWEGDVNATAVSMHYVCDGLFGVLGTQIVPMFRYADYKYFVQEISEAGAPVKSDLVLELLDFEDGDIPGRITPPTNTDYELEVVENGREGDDAGLALQINNGGSSSATLNIDMNTAIEPSCTSVSLDMNFVSSAVDGYLFSLYIQNKSSTRIGYQLQFCATPSGAIEIHECSNDPDNSKRYTQALATLPMGEWFNLRVEYYPVAGTSLGVKVYVNDTCVYVTNKPYYNPDDRSKVEGGRDPLTLVYNGMNGLRFSCFGGNASVVMLDNIDCAHDAGKTFDTSDYNPGGSGE